MAFWSWGICPKEMEVWRGCGLPEEGLAEVEEALCFLTVTSIQTREALGTRPTLGGIWACNGRPPSHYLAKLWAFNQPLSPHSICSCWKK